MTKEEIKRRYKETVIPENNSPHHFEKPDLADIDAEVLAYNPLCGDKFRLYFPKSEGLGALHYHGIGCALSKASGSLMIRSLADMDGPEAIDFARNFIEAVSKGESTPDMPEHLRVLVELKNFEGREDCITLTWKALLNHLESKSES